MKVEVLYFDGCPSYESLLPRLTALLAREGVEDAVEPRHIESMDAAEQDHFLGSPTIRIEGEDVDPGAASRSDFGLKCRLYRTDGVSSGLPPEEWVVSAVRRHKETSRG